MAYDKVVDSAALEAGLRKVGDSIRAKAGTNEMLEFPDAMSAMVDAIDTSKPEQAKTATPSTSQQVIKPDSGYTLSQVTVNAMPTATQATPSISVSSGGLITASATQTAGYVAAGTKSATKQLSTQAAKTVTPSLSQQTAVASGAYTTGAVTVAAITSTLLTSLDADFKAANIAEGVNMFGLVGTHVGGGSKATGSVTAANNTITVSGLSFTPTSVCLWGGQQGNTYVNAMFDNIAYRTSSSLALIQMSGVSVGFSAGGFTVTSTNTNAKLQGTFQYYVYG